MRRIRRSREHAARILRQKKGENDFEFVYNRDQQPYDVRFVQVVAPKGNNLRPIKPRADYPVARLYPDGSKKMIPWTPESLRKCFRHILAAWSHQQGGVWDLEIVKSVGR